MNFTGCSTYTSLSGVKKEMRFAVPLEIAGAVVGLSLWVTAMWVV
jgi:acetyl-CoA decarbonylase/synthase complex subunit gamma